jgi:hypothetical protein
MTIPYCHHLAITVSFLAQKASDVPLWKGFHIGKAIVLMLLWSKKILLLKMIQVVVINKKT